MEMYLRMLGVMAPQDFSIKTPYILGVMFSVGRGLLA